MSNRRWRWARAIVGLSPDARSPTPFAARPPANLPDDDLAADMQESHRGAAGGAGFVHYRKTSAFAPGPGHQAQQA